MDDEEVIGMVNIIRHQQSTGRITGRNESTGYHEQTHCHHKRRCEDRRCH